MNNDMNNNTSNNLDNNMSNNTSNNLDNNNTGANSDNNVNNNPSSNSNNNMNNNTSTNPDSSMSNNANSNTNNNMSNSINNLNQNNQSPSTTNKSNNSSIIKIVVVIASIAVVLLIGFNLFKNISGGGNKMSANKYISYLPKDKSEYDAICTKESDYGEDNMKFSEVIGMKTMDSLKYVSYTFINVVGRKDGKAIVENAESKEKLDEVVKFIEKTSLGVTGEFKDGEMVFKYGKSNYEFSNANESKEYFRTLGYTCE